MLKTCLINCCCLPFQAQPMRIYYPLAHFEVAQGGWGCVSIWPAVPQDGGASEHSVTSEGGKRARNHSLLPRDFASRSLQGNLTRIDNSNSR